MTPPPQGAMHPIEFFDRRPLPALIHSPCGPLLPYAAVLEEALSPVGVHLWQLLRDTTLWGTAERDRREGLFADEARRLSGVLPDVEDELNALAVLVRDPAPDAGPIIAHLCGRVCAWAEGQGLTATALAFAQAAALADRTSARFAYDVGRLSRVRAEYGRAETWYKRALVLAKNSGDKESLARIYGGLANVQGSRGNYSQATILMSRMARLARRHGLWNEMGGACHGLAVLSFEAGDVTNGMGHAREAIRVLGASHESIPRIVHDMAVALMDRCGAFPQALLVLHALLPHIPEPAGRVIGLANLARAAGATGEASLFEPLWTDTWPILDASDNDGFVNALLALASGAASLHQFDRARKATTRALEMAEESTAGKAILVAESLLASLDGEEKVRDRKKPADSASTDEAATEFADDLVSALRLHSAPPGEATLLFSAVLKSPEDPQPAYAFARALRAQAEYERAEAWFRHTIRLAQLSGDTLMQAMCLGGLGTLYLRRGDLGRAYESHLAHLEFARQEGMREMEGIALVDLCAVSIAADQGNDCLVHAKAALTLLGPHHPLLPRMAHDLALYLMESRRDFESALLLFRALTACAFPPEDKLIVEASLARAAAGAGEAQVFEEGWVAVWSANEGRTENEINAWALIHIAHGALLRGLYEHAARAAQRANTAATTRGEAHLAATAQRLIQAAEDAAKTHARPGLGRDPAHDARGAQQLARGIATALRPKRRQNDRDLTVPTEPTTWMELRSVAVSDVRADAVASRVGCGRLGSDEREATSQHPPSIPDSL